MSFPGIYKKHDNQQSHTGTRLLCEKLEHRRMLATLTVNVKGDFIDTDDGNLTLREAVEYVSGDEVPQQADLENNITGDLGQNDTIQFASNVTGAIDLAFGELMIKKSVVIQGPGRNVLTIDAGGNSRIFNTDDNTPGFLADIAISGTMPGIAVSRAGYRLAA